MADTIAIVALGVQYSFITLIVALYGGKAFRLGIALFVFLLLAGIALAVWHIVKKSAAAWAMFALESVLVGIAFLGVDWLEAYSQGQSNPMHMSGLLGLPLTLLICPVGTMICLAGLVRAFYSQKRERV